MSNEHHDNENSESSSPATTVVMKEGQEEKREGYCPVEQSLGHSSHSPSLMMREDEQQAVPSVRSSVNALSVDKSSGRLTNGSSRVSSLGLRKMPPEILLVGHLPADLESLADEDDDRERSGKANADRPTGFFNALCLNPRFELRTQFLLSFGSLSVLSIALIVITCVTASICVGENSKKIFGDTIEGLTENFQGLRVRYLAESLDHRLFPRDVSELVYQATLDRFEGYPLATDEQVPFQDIETGKNGYPIVGPYVPLEWNVTQVVTDENFEQHLQTRQHWYGDIPISTASAVFHIQGACDPAETDPSSPTYHPGCSVENNDIDKGGIENPSDLTGMIYRKSAGLVPYLKALYEYNQDLRDLGVYFANGGSGATMNFPAVRLFVST